LEKIVNVLSNPLEGCARADVERKECVDAIRNCLARKITVVGGPGTGKTFLFREMLTDKVKCLTLTFVNSLVEDLSLELCGLSQVKTLHGYARSVLGKSVKVFPKLSDVIRQDARILEGNDVDFDKIFNSRDDENPNIDFYRKRKTYYDNYYGYASIIYEALKLFETDRDKIPVFDQILVDEFQDFNKLEVSLIDLLAEKSPILLAGDDDQALYRSKDANPDHIRSRHNNNNTEYSSFTLPFCSRCTRVVVGAVNDLLDKARDNGNLSGRIAKEFRYFDSTDKDKESAQYSKIVHAQVYAKQIPWYIEQQMDKIAGEQQGLFSCLVIAPTKSLCMSIVDSLQGKGLRGVEPVESREGNELTLLDGLKILMENRESNLGWRIAAEHLSERTEFETLLGRTKEKGAQPVADLIGQCAKKKAKKMLATLKKVANNKEVVKDELDSLMDALGMDRVEIKSGALHDSIANTFQYLRNPGLRKVPVKVTTVQSSKGLAADFVFITHFDDRLSIKDKNKLGRVERVPPSSWVDAFGGTCSTLQIYSTATSS
jgi:hypothetical protein